MFTDAPGPGAGLAVTVVVEVAVTVGPLLKQLDNERDALETIRRLESK